MIRSLGWTVAALLVMGGLCAAQAGPDEKRMDRQIRIFEKVLDTVLVDSPNWLVANQEPSYGYYIEERGAVFSFRASLVGREWWRIWDDDDDDDYDRERSKVNRRQGRKYERGKDELIETLLDFSEVLTTLEDNEWVEINVKLRDARYFREQDLRRLKMKARVSDLRAYNDGRLSEDEATDKIVIEED